MKLIPIEGRGNEYLKRPADSEWIWLDRYKEGFDRKQVSLGTKDLREAREKRDAIFALWLGEKPTVSKKLKFLFSDLWPIWVETKLRKRKATQESVKYSGKHLLQMAGRLYPDQINETWWENTYIPKKREESPDRKFFNEWKWLVTFLNYLHREGHIERLPRLTCPDGPRAEGLNLEDSEIAALYAQANENLKLQIDLGFKHFMRRSEVLLLPFAEINFTTGVLHLPGERTKTKKPRQIPLSPEVLKVLKIRKDKNESPFVFPSPNNPKKSIGRMGNDTAWKTAIARANKESLVIRHETTFHDLRHSGLSRAFTKTNRYAEICVVAGLSLEEAQATYLHFKADDTRFVTSLLSQKEGQ
jgi:integrase